jgi:hypothetical protein
MASTFLGSVDHRLPNELTLLVVDHVAHDRAALCALAQTCRGLQHLAEAHLYRTLELLSVTDLDVIIAAFAARRERARAVHTLKILYRYRETDLQVSMEKRTAFNECVARMVNLREWHIESPYDNFQWEEGGQEWVEGDMERFRQALETACVEGPPEEKRLVQERRLGVNVERTVGLALLESLTIHSHGANADFWDLDGFHCLFRHPRLRYLHVSCLTLPDHLPDLAPHARTTPLTTLVFDECQLSPHSLRSILSMPEKLKHLTLGENIFNINGTTPLAPKLTLSPDATLDALAVVAHSLESLTHLDSKWQTSRGTAHVLNRMRPASEGMRRFDALKYLECDTVSFLHQAIVMNHDLAPPNLDTLRIRRHWGVFVNLFDQLPAIEHYTALPSLATLEFVQASDIWNELSLAEYICDAERSRSRHAAAFQLYNSGINLKVSIELHKSASLIPPYLHGETVPVTRCLYDASQVGFHPHVDPDDVPPVDDASRDASPTRSEKAAAADLPATDQLSPADLARLQGSARRTLDQLKSHFSRGYRLYRASSLTSAVWDDDDGDGDFTLADDNDTDEEFDAMVADIGENAGDEEAFLQFIATIQEDGELDDEYGDDDEDDDDEDDDEDDDDGLD